MTEDHGPYQPHTPGPPADDEVESIGQILERLVDRHPWGPRPDPPSPSPCDGGRRRPPGA